MRLATELAAMRRGCVWPMIWRLLGGEELGSDPNFQPPRPSAKAILGNWVVLPEPVSPQTMITWCACMAAMMSSRRAETGNDSGNSMTQG